MNWKSFGHYMREHGRAFLFSAGIGVFASLVMVPWGLDQVWVRSILASNDFRLPVGVLFFLVPTLFLVWPSTIDFWRRYRRTQSLARPPLQTIDLIEIAVFCAALSLFFSQHIFSPPISVSGPMSLLLYGAAGLFAIWLLLSLAWSRRKEAKKPGALPALSPSADYPDDPITDDSQDLLGRKTFADKLYEQIVSLPFPNSFVFGLQGGWGEGKTSVLNLLHRRLESNPFVISVAFNPWYFATEAALIQSFYERIERSLQTKYILPELRPILRRYQALLTLGLRSLGFGLEFRVRDDVDELRSQLESSISRTGCRLVVLIDDIDRLHPPELLTVFKLARLSARLQNTVFLLSFDPVVITQALQNEAVVDSAFLEKIVQKPVPLPPAEQRDIDRFLLFSDSDAPGAHRSAIDRLLDELSVDHSRRQKFDEKFVHFYRANLRRLFRTIRQAKRYLNGLRSTLPSVVGEVDLYDFFLLEALRDFFPAVYRDIWGNPWIYVPPWSLDSFLIAPFGLTANADEKYRRIREHIERLIKDEPAADVVREILEEIFFVEVKNALGRSRTDHSAVGSRYRAEKRLTHPECFPKYFFLRIPSGELADQFVEDIIANWNQTPVAGAEAVVADALTKYREAGQLLALFDKLNIFVNLFSSDHVRMVVRALYRSVPEFSRDGMDPWDTEYGRSEGFLLRLIEQRAESGDIDSLLEEVVREVSVLPYAVLVVMSCHRERGGSLFRIYDHINIGTLRALAAERLCGHYVRGERDIFEELPERDWGFVLYQWGTDWMTLSGESRLIAREYVMSLIDRRPEHLGKLLRHFTEKLFPREGLRFRFDEFCQVYDPSAVADRLQRYGERALTGPEEKQAADLFLQEYAGRNRAQGG